MRSSGARLMGTLVGLLLAGLLLASAWPLAGAGGTELPPSGAGAAAASPGQGTPLSSLVSPAVEGLTGEAGLANQEASHRANPEAFLARQRSRTAYANLSADAARQVAAQAFPEIVDHPAGGAPSLSAGERLARYVAANVAQIELPGGHKGVVESMGPMAEQTAPGHWTPLNLGLVPAVGGFAPANPDEAVRIPAHAGEGVQLPISGVSLTPTDAQGNPLTGSEGTVVGASVVYANTQTDADTLVKPMTDGFEIDSLLRSVDSPGELYFKVGVPAGAKLVSDASTTDGVRVVREGGTIATVSVPTAKDAAGAIVPVTMGVVGKELVLRVDHSAGEYDYPIVVDPFATDTTLAAPSGGLSNWRFQAEKEGKFESHNTGSGIVMGERGNYESKEHDELLYQAHGAASVAELEEESTAGVEEASKAVTKLEIANSSKVEETLTLATEGKSYGRTAKNICVGHEGTCGVGAIAEGNVVRFTQTATESGTEAYGFWGELNAAKVSIRQEKGPEVGFNTSESNLAEDEGRQNVMYGSGGWLGEHNGGFELKAKDPGLGVSEVRVRDLTAGSTLNLTKPLLEEKLCSGVWCNPEYGYHVTYSNELVEGENQIELYAENAAHMSATYSSGVIKVDNTKPYGFKISGLPAEGGELSAAPHKVRVEATDGTSPTPSSGIKSLEIKVDGKEVGVSQGYCTPGPCTAGAEWTIDAESLGAGIHRLEVIATDNANNVAGEEFTFAVTNAKPISTGPGWVDPITGQFTLTATDLNVAGVGGISRTHTSRFPSGETNSPFGPQWAVSATSTQSLIKLKDGSVLMTGTQGAMTIFNNKEGKLESPEGDANVKLTSGESESKPVYYLENAADASKTKFALPTVVSETPLAGAKYFSQDGISQFNPSDVTVDSSGNLWIASSENVQEYKYENNTLWLVKTILGFWSFSESCAGKLLAPAGVAIDHHGNVWVSDSSGDCLAEFNEKGEYVNSLGSAGTGSGQFKNPEGLTVDAAGNVWVADSGNNRVEEFNEKREFVRSVGKLGTGNGEFKNPTDVTVNSAGDVWVDDKGNSRIQEFSPSGSYMTQLGSEGSGNGQFKSAARMSLDSEGRLWVADSGNSRIEVFAPTGAYLEQFGKAGWGAGEFISLSGIATHGNDIYALNGSTVEHFVDERRLPPQETWLPTVSEGPLATPSTTYSFQTVYAGGQWITEPTEELAPKPAGVSCPPEPEKMEKGCRALLFKYAKETNAGEGQSEWKEYNGRLMQVSLEAYNPSSKKMEETHIAQYAYDKQGRLRAEWDPRISPSLKTIYGYDAEGHVTSLTPPGQESWAFTYGTIAGDANAGRLLKVTRASASAELWNGKAPEHTEGPKITGTATVGTRLAVIKGVWSNSPVAYTYAWEDCNVSGGECAPITGATNPNYTVASTDVGHTIVAQVSAINGGGSVLAVTSATSVVSSIAPSYAGSFGAAGLEGGQFKEPKELALDGSGNVWVADYGNNRIEEFSSTTAFIRAVGTSGTGAGQFKNPTGVAVSPTSGNVYITDSNNNRVEEFTASGSFVRMFGFGVSDGKAEFETCTSSCRAGTSGSGNGEFTAPNGITVDPNGNVWVTDGNNRVQEFTSSGAFMLTFGSYGTGNGQFNVPNGLAVCGGNLYVTDINNDRVEEFTLFGGYESQFGSPGTGNGQFTYASRIGCEPNNGLLYVSDKSGNRVEEFNLAGTFVASIGSGGSGIGQFKEPIGIAVSPSGAVYVSDSGNSRVQEWTPANTTMPSYSSQFGSAGTGAGQLKSKDGLTVDASGNVWVTDTSNNRVEEFNENGEFVKTLGFGVSDSSEKFEICTSSCQAGNYGSGNGQFKAPDGIAVDAHGNVWVADTYRLEEFSSEGAYIRTVGSHGTGAGQFNDLEDDLTTDASGNLWVADGENNRVQEFNEKGEFLKTFGFGVSNGGAELQSCTSSCRAGLAGSGNGQFHNPSDVAVDSWGDVWVDDSGNHRLEEFNAAGAYVAQSGSSGTGPGQFKEAVRLSRGPEGNLWVADSGNGRIQVLSAGGAYIGQFGSKGTGSGEFQGTGDVGVHGSTAYVLDSGNSRVQEWTVAPPSEGEHVAPGPGSTIEYRVPVGGTSTGAPNLSAGEVAKWAQTDVPTEATAIFPSTKPMGWPASEYAPASIYYFDERGRVVNVATPGGGISTSEYNETNDVVRTLSADNRAKAVKEANPAEAAKLLDTESTYNSEGTELLETLGPQHTVKLAHGKTKEDEEVLARSHVVNSYDEGAPGGETYRLLTKAVSAAETSSKEEFDKREVVKSYSGQENLGWKLRAPTSVTVDPSGLKQTTTTVYNSTTGAVVETMSPSGSTLHSGAPTYWSQFGSSGGGSGQLNAPWDVTTDSSGDVWVADMENNRIDEFNSSGGFVLMIGGEVNKTKVEGGGTEAEKNLCTAASGNVCKAGKTGTKNGFLNAPEGVAIDSSGHVWVSDTENNRVQEFSSAGAYIRQFGTHGSGNGQLSFPSGLTIDSSGNVWVADTSNNRVEEFSSEGAYLKTVGSSGSGNGQFNKPTDVGFNSEGDMYVLDQSNNRIEEFNASGAYIRAFGSEGSGNGQMKGAWHLSVGPENDIWLADGADSRIEVFSPSGEYIRQFGSYGAGSGQINAAEGVTVHGASVYVVDEVNNRIDKWIASGSTPGDTKTIYYSAAANGEYSSCGEHPEWVNLVCEVLPAEQPGGSSPSLPVKTVTYNMLDETGAVSEKFGAVTRTKTETYDAAGRPLTSEVTSTSGEDKALPAVTDEYSEATGLMVKQSTTVEGKTKSVTSAFNKLGEIETYTDADGNVAKYAYDEYGRLKALSEGKEGEAASEQTYAYDATTGTMNELVDSQGANLLKFTASYDVGDRMTGVTYPNAMNASYTYNSVGEAITVEYAKTAHCKTSCNETWFKDSIVPSMHGEAISQTSTLSSENYSYDSLGRLVETQETPAGKGCEVRLYAYDEESNRLSQTTRTPGTEGKCSTSGGTTQSHLYDSAHRLIDSGVTYDVLDNVTKLPAVDAGKEEGELASTFYVDNQVERQVQNGETIKYFYDPAGRTRETISEGKTASTVMSHYSGAGEVPSWTSEGVGKWSRIIIGIDGSLTAIQKNGEAPVLQIHDLQGDIVGTAAAGESNTELFSTYNSTEFGVPTNNKPPRYSWLGAGGVTSELPSGVSTQGGLSYAPQVARALQIEDPVPPGAAPGGAGSSAPYITSLSSWTKESGNEAATNTVMEAIAEREAAAREAEEEWEEEEEEFGEEESAKNNSTPRVMAYASSTRSRSVHHKRKKTRKKNPKKTGYNACTGHANPKDPSEACCVPTGGEERIERNPAGHPCDVYRGRRCEEVACKPAQERVTLDCPEGTFPSITIFGEPFCAIEGDYEE